jgi:hypothetical protein
MSQIPMTDRERVRALQRFSYTEPESAFLSLAALHSGYFLRRQYARFLGAKDGGQVSQLVERALANDHVKTSTWRQNTQLYHVCARPFYEALGQGENRHRRARSLLAIKNKIMTLDFVLAQREYTYLATEQEKLDYFTQALKLDPSVLPAKLYHGALSTLTTIRYFVEKYPIFLSGAAREGAPAVAAFCFVDEGAVSLSGFETFLQHYHRLFASLPEFDVVYVADKEAWFRPAARIFERFQGQAHRVAPDPLVGRLLEYYFAMRRLCEAKEFSSFDRAKLIRFRQEQREFSGAKKEALFARWKAGGDAAVTGILAPEPVAQPMLRGTFSTHLLEHDYGMFGRFPG